MHEITMRKWRKYLLDAEQNKDSIIKMFVATFVLTVDKQAVDTGVVANRIRAIPNVTTVQKDIIGSEDAPQMKALYHIKFVLEKLEDLNTFLNKVLKAELQKLDGVRVNQYRGVEQIEIGR